MFFKYWKTSLHMNAKNMYIYILKSVYTIKSMHSHAYMARFVYAHM